MAKPTATPEERPWASLGRPARIVAVGVSMLALGLVAEWLGDHRTTLRRRRSPTPIAERGNAPGTNGLTPRTFVAGVNPVRAEEDDCGAVR
jgi:hypothetical protein